MRAASAISILDWRVLTLSAITSEPIRARPLGIKVTAPQLLVPSNTTIQDASVQNRQDLDSPRPILGHELPLERPQVHPAHAHEPAARQAGLTSGAIPEAELARHQRVANVIRVPVEQQLDIREPDRLLVLDDAASATGSEGRLTRSSFGTECPPTIVDSRL